MSSADTPAAATPDPDIPEQFREQVAAFIAPPIEDRQPDPEPTPEPKPEAVNAAEVVRIAAAAGLDLAFAQVLIAEQVSASALEARVTSEKTARDEAKAREAEIRALCGLAKQDDLAAGYVTGGMTVDAVKDHHTKITAKLEKAEIDGGLQPDHETKKKPVIDVAAVYRRLNTPAANAKN